MYNRQFVDELTQYCAATIPHFNKKRFLSAFFNKHWDTLELKQRVRHLAQTLASELSGNFKRDIKTVVDLTRHVLKTTGKENTFHYIFLADYVELYGMEHPAESFRALEDITVLSSAEFAIRPFIACYTDMAMKQMLQWAKHKHPSVRRLASEGCRPRLPWGMALRAFKKDPTPVLPILETLKNDPSEYVRKSVANNLNDIAKDNPQVVKDIITRWQGISKETDWIVKHGARTLLKKADEHTLSLFGVSDISSVAVSKLALGNKKIRIGDELSFSFNVLHKEPAGAKLRIEYIIYYKKAGSTSKKVFKITESTFEPQVQYNISRRQSFKDMTTRRHYAGRHELAIAVNGAEKARVKFDLEPAM